MADKELTTATKALIRQHVANVNDGILAMICKVLPTTLQAWWTADPEFVAECNKLRGLAVSDCMRVFRTGEGSVAAAREYLGRMTHGMPNIEKLQQAAQDNSNHTDGAITFVGDVIASAFPARTEPSTEPGNQNDP